MARIPGHLVKTLSHLKYTSTERCSSDLFIKWLNITVGWASTTTAVATREVLREDFYRSPGMPKGKGDCDI